MFLGIMIAFVLQKMYFLWMTWHDGTAYSDVLDVIYHGLKLDVAVAGYMLVVPFLLLFAYNFVGGRIIPRILKGYYLLFALLVAVIIVSDASLYPFWHFKLDASVFLYTDKPKDAMASVSVWFIVQRLLWIAIWTWVIWRITGVLKTFENLSDRGGKILPSGINVILFAVIFLMIRGGVGKGTNNVSDAYYSDNQYLNHASVNPVFNLIYSLGKQEDFGSEAQFYDEKECESILTGIYHTDSQESDTLLNTSRPDVLLIIWEGACTYVCDSLGAAPRLKTIAREGVSFTNCIASSFRTDRGQLSLLSGWPAIPKTSLMKIPEKCDHLSVLPRRLLNEGYETTFWYGGDIAFANTGGYMHQAGFQKTVSDKDFSQKEKATAWGVYDGTLLEKLTQKMLKESGDKRTFHTVMTLSSHEPWQVPVKKFDDEKVNSFYYTDSCIGDMIDKLKKSPRWKNLLVIITADHGIAVRPEQGLADEMVIRIPMIWTGGAVKEVRNIDKIINQSDLPATLLGQMRLPHDEFIFSRDVMSKSYVYPTAFHCYNGGITFADSTGMTTYDLDGLRSIFAPDEARERKAKATLQKLYRKIADM